jgi:TRAP-type mannitol/chloroaromatic compound transport system permease small subunit
MDVFFGSISKFIKFIGDKVAWLNFAIIILISLDVISRYLFNTTKAWVLELEWQMFALIFLFGMSYAYQEDKHVRVDLFYSKMTERSKKIVDIIGNLLLLIPWCIVVIITSSKYAYNSYYILEGSPNPNGLPFRFIIKFCIVIGFVLLLMEGISQIYFKSKSLYKS